MREITRRIMLEGPSCGWYAGHGGDEYGNCSLYFRTPLFGIVLFVDLDYQDEVELPEPGENAWVDAKYYPGWEADSPDQFRSQPG